MQQNLFGQQTKKKADFFVFHDESEARANKGWLLIGLLFINRRSIHDVEQVLNYHREQEENYMGEIHFCDLPKRFEGPYGAKARVARRWVRSYQENLFQHALFTCLAIDRWSPRFEHQCFKHSYHAYNRFTAMAIKAGISWLLTPLGYDEIDLIIISDGKNRKSRPDDNMVDNFEAYIPYRVELDNFQEREMKGGSVPRVTVKSLEVQNSATSNLLQLTDILLGAVQSALVASSEKPTKRELANMVASWCEDLRKPPWKQEYKMHRKFSVWGFPNAEGKAFSNLPLAISACLQQPLL